MPSRRQTLAMTAKRMVLGANDLEMLGAAAMSVGTFVYSLGSVLVRLVMFVTFPVSVLLLYPLMRSYQRKLYAAAGESRASTEPLAEPLDLQPHPQK